MKKRFWLFPAKALLTLACGVIIGFLLLLAVYALPVEPMIANVRASIPALNGEWAREESYETLIPGYQGTQLDNSTDAAMLLHAIHQSDAPLTVRAADAKVYTGGGNAFLTLLAYGKSEDVSGMNASPVARYWHGYLVMLKPLLCMMSYLDIRMVLTIVQGALLAAVIAGFCKRKLERYLPAFLLSLLCITPSATGLSMQFSTVFVTMLLAMAALLYLPKKRIASHGFGLFFLLVGMLTSYVDYLTYPLASFGMPFVLCMLLYPSENMLDAWKRLIFCGVCWAVGYLGMWAGKWVIAGAFGSEIWFWPNLFAKIGERSSHMAADMPLNYLTVLKTVCGVFFKRAYLFAGIAALAAWAAVYARRRSARCPLAQSDAGFVPVLLCTALLPFVWFFFTQNHSYNHAFYTSRNLSVTVFAVCCILMSFLPKKLYKSSDL